MSTWGSIARHLDLGGAWKVARHSMRHGGMLHGMAAYFTGRNMGTYGRLANRFSQGMAADSAKSAGSYALKMSGRQMKFGTAAARIGFAGVAGGAGAFALSRTDPGRRVMKTGMTVGAGVLTYKGLKYGMSRWPAALAGGSFFSKAINRRGVAALGGIGMTYGLM